MDADAPAPRRRRTAAPRPGSACPVRRRPVPCATTSCRRRPRSRRTRRGRRPLRSRRGTSRACSRARARPHLGGRCVADVRSRRSSAITASASSAGSPPRGARPQPRTPRSSGRSATRPAHGRPSTAGARRLDRTRVAREQLDGAARARAARSPGGAATPRARAARVRPSTIVLKRSAGHSSTCGKSAASVPPTASHEPLVVGHRSDVQRDDPAGRRCSRTSRKNSRVAR